MCQALQPLRVDSTLHVLRALLRDRAQSHDHYETHVYGLRAARSLARSIQDASDPLIRHLSGEFPDDIRGRLIQGPASFTVTCFAHFELGVIASLPMNHQIDLVAVDASDDLNNDGA
jgi:hypothetical protein